MELILTLNRDDSQVISVVQQNTKQSFSVEQVSNIQTLSLDNEVLDEAIKNSTY